MATALTPAVQPALSGSQWNPGQNVQQVGTEGRQASDIGIPEVIPQPWASGPLLTSAQPSGNAAGIESDGISYLGPEYQGIPVDHTPWPDNQGDPDRPSDSWIAERGHDWDQGAPAALRKASRPDIGDPVLQTFATQSTERQPVFSPNGQMVELPGTRTAPSENWYNNRDVGIVYIQESERAFYNTPAEVPGQYDGPGGLYDPDDRYSSWIYNDGGIPTSYVEPPDPPVAQTGASQQYIQDDIGYGVSY
jgi:hypothetical protein